MEVAGYLASLVIGISLGLIGGGGSILTLPVLVYLFRVQPVLATAYSLFIVGSTSLVGALPKYRQGLIHLKTALIFGLPSIAAVFATRKFIVPNIPEAIIQIGDVVLTKSLLMMLLFALLMVVASFSMIRNKTKLSAEPETKQRYNYPLILAEGILVGTITGLVGAGGGFLIIPALVLLSNLPMKQAVGTSLLIIAAKSLIGFTSDITTYEMDWPFLLLITGIASAGIFIGNWISTKVHADKLKKGFGWFVLVMGLYILVKEIFLPGESPW
ncbi:sulfite exporter TauE/SafE family protein [Flavisolibacter sp. BT320]|nr:sulfite exporter TauE/SafE family protein [Flavisolibacter longurius]